MKPCKAFALRISQLLIERNMSKYRLEQLTGISHHAMRCIFNESNQDTMLSTVMKVCAALGITMEEFFASPLFDLTKIDYEQ